MKTLSLICCAMLCALLLCSCDRDDNLCQHAEGYVRDYGTLAPVANTPLVLVGDMSDFGGTYQDIDTVITDANGFASFDFAPTDGFVQFRLLSDKHYGVNTKSYGGSQGSDIEFDLIADPKAWLKLHIKNVNPLNEGDLIDYDDIAPSLVGMDIDTIVTREVQGNRNLPLYYLVRRDGIIHQFNDTVNVPAYDTLLYEVLY